MTDVERDNKKRDESSIDSFEVFANWYINKEKNGKIIKNMI